METTVGSIVAAAAARIKVAATIDPIVVSTGMNSGNLSGLLVL